MSSASRRRSRAKKAARHGPSVVVLAAGASSRFLGTKQLAELGGKTLLERVIESIPSADVLETVVVLGHEAEAVSKSLRSGKGVKVVVNEDYRAGMATSIKAGIGALASGTEGALLLMADQSLVTRRLLRRMVAVFEAKGPGGKIVAAAHGDTVTPPVIFSKEYFRELGRLRGDKGARSVIQRHRASLSLVRLRSRTVLADIDTRRDLEAARRLLES